MGFYGNITNTSRTQFQFDLTYPSRFKMEAQCSKDGVYVGRYVLVEYDSNPNNVVKDGYRKGKLYEFKEGDPLYASVNLEDDTKITYFKDDYWDYDWSSTDVISGVIEGTIVRVKETEDQYTNSNGKEIDIPAGQYSFFECIGSYTEEYEYVDPLDGVLKTGIRKIAKFKRAEPSSDNYTQNYEEDRRAYGKSIGRGWDSTVWQKVYENGKEKYVMIAELNSVIPTFDIQADAPSMSPLTPHFDEGSTNVYYKLHWQPQWGLRTKAANGELKTYVLDKNGKNVSSKDPIFTSTSNITGSKSVNYPSDASTKWEKYEYDTIQGTQAHYQYNKDLGTWEIPLKDLKDDDRYKIPAAIYFNKAGFDENIIQDTSIPKYNMSNAEWDGVTDFISVAPTGWSGHQYSPHDGSKEMQPSIDTQELTVMLPSIGNTISKVWDLIYGGLNTNDNIKATGQRNRNIDWDDPESSVSLERFGLRLIGDKYQEISLDQMPGGFQDDTYYRLDEATGSYKLVTSEDEKVDQYYTRSGGYRFNRQEVSTIAGCINSVHDLMGMIIVEKDVEDDPEATKSFENISSNHIYYYPSDGTYRIKDVEYSYENLTDDDFIYTKINTENEEYSPYMYYVKNAEDKFVAETDGEFIVGTDYYIKSLNVDQNSLFTPTGDLNVFTAGFYRASTGSYIYKADGDADDGVIYYNINSDKLKNTEEQWPYVFTENYEKNKFYYKEKTVIDEAEREVYTLMQTDVCNREKSPFFIIPQEAIEKKNHPYTISIQNKSNYDENKETPPQDGDVTWKGPYRVANKGEGYWDETANEGAGGWVEGDYAIPTYFFTSGTYYQRYAKESAGENPEVKPGQGEVDDNEKEFLDDYTFKQLMTIPDDGYGYLLDRPKIISNIEDEAESYGAPVRSYKVKLIDFKTLDENIKNHLYYALTEPYEIEVTADDGTVSTETKTRFIKWIPVTQKDIDEWYYGLGRRQTNSQNKFDPNEASNLMPKQTIYYIETTTETLDETSGEIVDNGLKRLYEANRYYYIGSDNISYIKDRKAQFTEGVKYFNSDDFKINKTDYEIDNGIYAITPQGGSSQYYAPNKYYYYDDILNKFIIDTSAVKQDIPYYQRNDVYISADTSNIFAKGSIWNLNAIAIPNTITLGKRVESFSMKELEGFGRSFNTINGLILEMNRLIAANNYTTRDRNTLQGAINYLNDIIVKLDSLTPGDFPVVDYFGRLHGATAETDKWIDVAIDPNVINPKLIITHEYNPIEIDSDEIDLNETAEESDIELPLYAFDETGHKVGESTYTITLPSSFKTFQGDNNLDAVDDAATNVDNVITATNAQDIVNIEGSNKWIGIDTATEKTIKIGHKLSGVTKNSYGLAENETLGDEGTLEKDKTFEVPYFSVDEAGHVTSASTQTVSMPSGFKSFSVGSAQTATTNVAGSSAGTSTATKIEDSFSFNPGNTWINLAINKSASGESAEKSLIISHALSALNATNIGDTTNRTPGFGETFNTLHISTDNAGHLIGAGINTVKIPGLELTKDVVETSNVLVGVDYSYSTENNKGIFKEVKAALGSLALNSYTPIANGSITAQDTLDSALGKIEKALGVINGDVNTTGSISSIVAEAKKEILGDCSEDFNSLAKIETWVSDKTENEEKLIDRVKTLEDKALPQLNDLNDGEFYLIKMIDGQPTWINLASWTGGKY